MKDKCLNGAAEVIDQHAVEGLLPPALENVASLAVSSLFVGGFHARLHFMADAATLPTKEEANAGTDHTSHSDGHAYKSRRHQSCARSCAVRQKRNIVHCRLVVLDMVGRQHLQL